jgi:Domain of unknown function (DUF3850)
MDNATVLCIKADLELRYSPKKLHQVKISLESFRRIVGRIQTFDLRRCDSDFKEGNLVALWEYNLSLGEYTGNYIICRVGFVSDPVLDKKLEQQTGIRQGYRVWSILNPSAYYNDVTN